MTDAILNVNIKDLLLDPENPRLPESIDRDQQSMLDHIAETTSIEELMEAIAENDFFQGEPIIVVPDQKNKGKFLVVEGNRRLTAVKLLNDPALCTSPGARMRAIAGEAKHKPVEIPVVKRNTRQEVLPYLGFRHITGGSLLCQCGAQENGWPSKTLEAHPIKLRPYFQSLFDYPSTMFTPICYRAATGEWVDNCCGAGVMVADRGRILNLINAGSQWAVIVQMPWFNAFEQEFADMVAQT